MTQYRYKILSEGAAIDETWEALTYPRRLVAMTAHLDTAPTSAGSFVVTLDSAEGAEYDTVLYSLDPSTGSTTDIANSDFNMPLTTGDRLRVTYANPDARKVAVILIME